MKKSFKEMRTNMNLFQEITHMGKKRKKMELSVLEQCSSKVIDKSMYICNFSKVEVPSAVISTLLSVGYLGLCTQ